MNRRHPSDGQTGFRYLAGNNIYRTIFLIAFCVYLNMFIINQSLPLYADEIGASAQAVGFISGLFGGCGLLMRPISGQVVDNEDRMKLLRGVLCSLFAAVLILAFAKSYYLLVVSRAIYGLTWGIGSTLFMSIATSSLNNSNMAFGIGIFAMAQTIARSIAPLIALPLGARIGYSSLYKWELLLIAAGILLSFTIKIDHKIPKEKRYSINISRMISVPAIPHAALNFFNQNLKWTIMTFLALYAASIHVEGIAWYFTAQAIAMIASVSFASKVTDRFGAGKAILPGQLLELAAMVLIVAGKAIPVFVIAGALFGIGMAFEEPAILSECVKSSAGERGRATNTFYVGTDLGQFLGCYAAGVLNSLFGYKSMFVIMLIPTCIYAGIYLLAIRRKSTATPSDPNGTTAEC